MNIKTFSQYIEKIERTSSRNEITVHLAELFEKLSASEFKVSTYLLQGRVSPKYKTINFDMAEKMVKRSILQALDVSLQDFNKVLQEKGDLGSAAQQFKTESNQKDISVEEIYGKLLNIAEQSGEGSQDRKISLLSQLISEVDALSVRYLIRIPTNRLRLGFSDMTMLDALSWMQTGDKSLRIDLQQAYHVYPDLGEIGKRLKEHGIDEVKKIQPEIFTPIIMMRAQRLSSGEEIVEKIGEHAVEPKYDGFRLQVHKKGDDVKLFTRGLEDVTYMYPDVVRGVQNEVKADQIIFEGEAIGYNEETRSFLPFQETVQRKRKYGIKEKAREIPLKFFVFELLYLDGKNFIHVPFKDRRNVLQRVVNHTDKDKDTLILASHEITSDPKKVEALFDEALSEGLEGIISKKINGTYEPGSRNWNWVKFKRSYSSKIEDTIDAVVMGYYYGKGKRATFGMGAFLVGVFDKQEGIFRTIAKIGTGLSDDDWKLLKKKADMFQTLEKPKQFMIDAALSPDVFVQPEIVVEIRADEISRSPVHTAGRKLKPSKSETAEVVDVPGYALRFPRLERFRNDKSPEEATSLHEIEQMFQQQKK